METGGERLNGLIKYGIGVNRVSNVDPHHTDALRLLGILSDGAREYAGSGRARMTKRGTPLYDKMRGILEESGGDIAGSGSLSVKNKIDLQSHTLIMPNGDVYEFLLPSLRYFDIMSSQ